MKILISVTVDLTEEDVEDIIVTALEGGIGYWCCLDNTGEEYENAPDDEPTSITATKILLDGGELKLIDEQDDNKEYKMDLEDFISGVERWKRKGYDYYHAIDVSGVDCGSIDAECADGIIQCALFGDIQYG